MSRLISRWASFMGRGQSKRDRRRQTIYDVMERQRRALLRREDETVRRMLRSWKIAQKALAQALKEITRDIERAEAAGISVSPDWVFQRDKWAAFQRAVQEHMASLTPELIATAKAGADAAIAMGEKHVREMASALQTSFKVPPIRALERVASLLEDDAPHAEWFRRSGSRILGKARTVLIESMAKGIGPREIARRLVAEGVVKEKVTAVVTAREISLAGYRTAQREIFRANSDVVAGARIVSARDGRTCWRCLAQDGKLLEHGEKFYKHIACRCGLMPVLIIGDVPREGGDAWLRSQSEEVQKEKLGPGRWALWKDGTITLHDMLKFTNHPQWGPQLQELNLQELNRMARTSRRPAPPKTKVENGILSY